MSSAKTRLGLSLLLVALCCVGGGANTKQTPVRWVSIIQLLANPEKYDGKRVGVRGFYHSEFESYALYFSSEYARHGIVESSIWIWNIAAGADTNLFEAVNDDFVLVEGTFHHTPEGGGHMGLWPSELRDLTHFTRVPRNSTPISDPTKGGGPRK